MKIGYNLEIWENSSVSNQIISYGRGNIEIKTKVNSQKLKFPMKLYE